jgi:heat shock protein HtpX
MFAIFLVVGWAIGGYLLGDWVLGAVIFLVIAGLMNAVAYFFSSKIVLWSYHVKVVTESESPRLFRIVRSLVQRSDLPMPQIAIIPTDTPNAFATGRNPKHATVAATEGILKLLNDDELTGVLAHEMSHVKDRDILVMSVAATLAGAISFASRMFVFGTLFGGGNGKNNNFILLIIVAITAPIAAMLLQLAVSRSREYKADFEGAKLTGRPLWLASALRKLETQNKAHPLKRGNPATSSLFIVNPFSGGALTTLFSTHPPIEKRIARLEAMASEYNPMKR